MHNRPLWGNTHGASCCAASVRYTGLWRWVCGAAEGGSPLDRVVSGLCGCGSTEKRGVRELADAGHAACRLFANRLRDSPRGNTSLECNLARAGMGESLCLEPNQSVRSVRAFTIRFQPCVKQRAWHQPALRRRSEKDSYWYPLSGSRANA